MALGLILPGLLQPLVQKDAVKQELLLDLVRHADNTPQDHFDFYRLSELKPIVRLARHADNTPHEHSDIFGIPSVDFGMDIPVRRFKDAMGLLYKIPVLIGMIPALLPHKYKKPNFDYYSDRYERYDSQLQKGDKHSLVK